MLPKAGATHRGWDGRAQGAEGLRREGPPWGTSRGPGPRGEERQGATRDALPGAVGWALGAARGARRGAAVERARGPRGARAGSTAGGARAGAPRGSTPGGHAGRAQGAPPGGRRKGWGGEERGRVEGSSPQGFKSGDQLLQTLGHHGEREVGEERRLLREKNQMRERERGRGCMGGGGGRGPERAGLGRAGLGRTTGQNLAAHTTADRKPITNRNPKEDETNTRLNTTSDKEI
jgi:hypothetical protein